MKEGLPLQDSHQNRVCRLEDDRDRLAGSDLAREAFKKLLFKKPWKERRGRKRREKERSFSLAVAGGNEELNVFGGGRWRH